MEMTEEIYRSMSDEERQEYDAQMRKLREALDFKGGTMTFQRIIKKGKRSKHPRSIASRKPVRR